jgi:crotonobetainyl-CoA:carnitine CoA-transferase CaiB-like acyl-CoA transferase
VSDLLSGLRVVVSGCSRELRVAASWFIDLGADVRLRDAGQPDLHERLWLRQPEPATSTEVADLLIVEPGADAEGLSAPVTLHYSGSGTSAPKPNERLDYRELAGAGGVAIAIGESGRPPLPVPEGCLEHMIGTHVAAAGVAAVLDGTRTVEVAGVDVVAWSVATNVNLYVPYGSDWVRAGRRANGSGGGYPYSVFDVADGQFVLICRTVADWEALLDAMGRPSWAAQPRYRDRLAMARHYPEEVDRRMAPWLSGKTRSELVQLAAEFGFPGGPILRPEEVLVTPSLAHRWRTSETDGSSAQVLLSPFDVITTEAVRREPPPLSGTLVLDLSWVWSGPAIGVALADLGATVIKVESSTRPDNSRLRGKPTQAAEDPDAPALELTPYFHAVNRGKRSVSLNLKTPEGRALLRRLAGQADVIIENLSAGVMERFGIAPAQVHAENPDCVYLSLRGYREHPTTTGLRAYAPVLSAGAGIEALVGYDGEPPVGMMTYGLSDANAASQGLMLALAGLYARRSRSTGAAISLSQLEAAVVANGLNLVRAQTGQLQPLQPYREGEPVVSAEELPTAPWTSPDLFTTVATPWLGDLPVACLPWRRDRELPRPGRAGPVLGEDTGSELRDRLGLGQEQIRALRCTGVLL